MVVGLVAAGWEEARAEVAAVLAHLRGDVAGQPGPRVVHGQQHVRDHQRGVETVADEVDARTALANRIAALDDRLFSDLEGVGIDGEPVRLARDTRSRDRSRTLAGVPPSFS